MGRMSPSGWSCLSTRRWLETCSHLLSSSVFVFRCLLLLLPPIHVKMDGNFNCSTQPATFQKLRVPAQKCKFVFSFYILAREPVADDQRTQKMQQQFAMCRVSFWWTTRLSIWIVVAIFFPSSWRTGPCKKKSIFKKRRVVSTIFGQFSWIPSNCSSNYECKRSVALRCSR